MPPVTLNNNTAATFLNSAVQQTLGGDLATLDLQDIVDRGNDSTVIGSVEQFTKSLINVMINTRFEDSSYAALYKDPWFVDSQEWGAITQMVSVEIPAAKAASNWTAITSGVTTLGTYTIYLPVVHSKLYGKTDSWEIPIAITGTQWDTAWHNAEELRSFVAYVMMMVDNGIAYHMETMDYANRNNFIAEKISYANSLGATGIHVVNLVQDYVTAAGISGTGMTVEGYLATDSALIHGAKTITEFSRKFRKMSNLFNTEGRLRFTPEDRQVLQLLDDFDLAIQYNMRSGTYHEELVKLPGYSTVPFWQSLDDFSQLDVTIDVNGTPTNITANYIAGILADKWAILHTIVKHRTAAKVFEPEDITQYYSQFTDRYLNNLSMNAVIFVLADVAATP